MISKEPWYKEAVTPKKDLGNPSRSRDLARKKKFIQESTEEYLREILRNGRPVKEFLDTWAEVIRNEFSSKGEENYFWYERYDKEHVGEDLVSEFGKKGFLQGADLRGINFGGKNMSEFNLQGAKMGRLRHGERRVGFVSTNLAGANLRQVDARGADFTHANLSVADLSGGDFRGAKLALANFNGAVVKGANFHNANMGGVSLTEDQYKSIVGVPLITDVGDTSFSEAELNTFLDGYIDVAIWLLPEWTEEEEEHDNPDWSGEYFDRGSISPAALESITNDARDFLSKAYPLVSADLSQAGHDFFLTRNGHGTGFWDRDEVWGPYATALSELSGTYGSQSLWPSYGGLNEDGEEVWTLEEVN